jgi:glycosyltransferase involved in cell wall biosynthesis
MQEKPKLLFLITKSNFGGAQKYVLDLASSKEINSEFNVAVALGGNGELATRLQEKGVRVIHLKYLSNSLNPIKSIMMLRELNILLKKEKSHILHINSSVAGVIGTISGKVNKNKLVFTAHGWPYNENRSMIQKKLFKTLMNFVIKNSHKNIAVSKQIIKDSSVNENNFELIYLGIDKINFKEFSGLDQNKINILSIGELHPSKNHELAMRAIHNLKNKNIHYHIFGEGHVRKELENLIKELGLDSTVTLHGNIKDAKDYIDNFDIYLMPSRTEALSYTLLEASQSHVEILVSDAGGMKEVIQATGKGEIFKSGDQKDLEEKLSKMIKRVDKAKHKSNQESPNHFAIETMIEKTLDAYKKLLQP